MRLAVESPEIIVVKVKNNLSDLFELAAGTCEECCRATTVCLSGYLSPPPVDEKCGVGGSTGNVVGAGSLGGLYDLLSFVLYGNIPFQALFVLFVIALAVSHYTQ